MDHTQKRKLGYFEAVAATNPGCIVSMIAHLHGDGLEESPFQLAVQATSRRHPQLRCLLDKSREHLVPLKNFHPSPSQIQIVDSDDWEKIVHEKSNQAFDFEGQTPYWEVVLIRCGTNNPSKQVLLIEFHHCIGDGSSGYILINDILRFHQQYLTNGADAIDDASLPLLSSVEDLCFPNGPTDEEEAYLKTSLEKLQHRRRKWLPVLKFSKVPSERSEHSMLYRDGTKENLGKLIKACRSHGVTVGSVLAAAAYFSVAKMYMALDENKFFFDFDMDVNLRNRFDPALGNDDVSALIGMMAFSISVDASTTFWGLVKRVHAAIHQGLQEKQHFHYLEVNKRYDQVGSSKESEMAGDDQAPYQAIVDEARGKDWEELTPAQQEAASKLGENRLSWNKHGHLQDMNFSNIGRYFFETTYGSTKVEKIYCAGSGWCPTFGGYVFLIPSVTSLNYSLVYESSTLNDQVAISFLDLAVQLAENAFNLSESFSLRDFMS
jgi:NRPS condensation-like uncharacterized protein